MQRAYLDIDIVLNMLELSMALVQGILLPGIIEVASTLQWYLLPSNQLKARCPQE